MAYYCSSYITARSARKVSANLMAFVFLNYYLRLRLAEPRERPRKIVGIVSLTKHRTEGQ